MPNLLFLMFQALVLSLPFDKCMLGYEIASSLPLLGVYSLRTQSVCCSVALWFKSCPSNHWLSSRCCRFLVLLSHPLFNLKAHHFFFLSEHSVLHHITSHEAAAILLVLSWISMYYVSLQGCSSLYSGKEIVICLCVHMCLYTFMSSSYFVHYQSKQGSWTELWTTIPFIA